MKLKTTFLLQQLFLLPLVFIWLNSICQSPKKTYTKCEAIDIFLNSSKVDSNFIRSYIKNADTLVIVDMDSSLTACQISRFRGKPVKLITSGSLFDSVMKYSWPALKIDKTNLYRFSSKPIDFFIEGNGSILSIGEVKIDKRGRYIIRRIENGIE
jgi:predicted house-cleaning NTP pyrophosphatase (Maf/HAM1 superfamily)